ncbi:hypothetical protein [Chachezhania antarctica]|uniref:hypothetical protein n=1 Tax=Chachezhania antarctica TaxID=2340860 RepID=UPI000EB218FD|nr:hypothetical protein [Chachezhania antarctica]
MIAGAASAQSDIEAGMLVREYKNAMFVKHNSCINTFYRVQNHLKIEENVESVDGDVDPTKAISDPKQVKLVEEYYGCVTQLLREIPARFTPRIEAMQCPDLTEAWDAHLGEFDAILPNYTLDLDVPPGDFVSVHNSKAEQSYEVLNNGWETLATVARNSCE